MDNLLFTQKIEITFIQFLGFGILRPNTTTHKLLVAQLLVKHKLKYNDLSFSFI